LESETFHAPVDEKLILKVYSTMPFVTFDWFEAF